MIPKNITSKLKLNTMADAYTQIYIHVVMTVKCRKAQIQTSWENNLYKFITGLVQAKGHKMIAINGMPDHIHFFIGMSVDCSLSALVRETKKSTNNYINKNGLTEEKFYWQAGYGAFSYSHSHIGRVANYIARQKLHHRKKKLKEEYIQLLKLYEIEFKQQYLFDWIDK